MHVTITNRNTQTLITAVIARFIYLLLIFTLIPLIAHGQVNTEALRVTSPEGGFQGSINLSGNVSAGNTSIYELNTGGRLDYIHENNRSFIVYNYVYGYKNGEPFKNAAFIALRNTWQWKPRVAVEGFIQQQMNEFIRLQDRKLLGGGVRLTAVDIQNETTGLRFRTFVGIAAMAEREVIESTALEPTLTTNLLRSTNYLSLTLGMGDSFYLSAVQYLQFVPDNTSDYRYTADVNLDARLYQNVSLIFNLGYRLDNEPPSGIRPFDLSYTTGLRFRF
ncbi:MAG: DUF481 domain-containing protein [Oceanicaulis sp.]|nr:DUF481 domain-containing protein [Oceanicaulis sp.]